MKKASYIKMILLAVVAIFAFSQISHALTKTTNSAITKQPAAPRVGQAITPKITIKAAPSAGKWKIIVKLPSNRRALGTLKLYDKNGTSLMSIPCLGRSISQGAENVLYGNTPKGSYDAWLATTPYRSKITSHIKKSYGTSPGTPDGVIATEPRFKTTRSGIWIHGGDLDSKGSLRATHGCVRVSNKNLSILTAKIRSLVKNSGHTAKGDLVITE